MHYLIQAQHDLLLGRGVRAGTHDETQAST
jgi:hypothetical protein